MKEQKCVFTTMITVRVLNDDGMEKNKTEREESRQIVLSRMLVFKPSPGKGRMRNTKLQYKLIMNQ